jgi:hypothetical protein
MAGQITVVMDKWWQPKELYVHVLEMATSDMARLFS